jgi:hypothetical protein
MHITRQITTDQVSKTEGMQKNKTDHVSKTREMQKRLTTYIQKDPVRQGLELFSPN